MREEKRPEEKGWWCGRQARLISATQGEWMVWGIFFTGRETPRRLRRRPCPPASEVLHHAGGVWRSLSLFFVFFFFSSKVPFCVTTLGWGLAAGSLGWVSLHGLLTSARWAASGGKATGNGQGGRGWQAELAVHAAWCHGGNGWWRWRRGAQEHRMRAAKRRGTEDGGDRVTVHHESCSCLTAPAPKPEPRAEIPVKQVVEFPETMNVVSRVESPEETLGSANEE